MRRFVCGLIGIAFLVCVQFSNAQEIISKDFPQGPVRDRMVKLAAVFPKESNLRLEQIAFDGTVRDVGDAAKEMLNSTVVLGSNETGGKFQVFEFQQIAKEVPGPVIDRLFESLQLNMAKGDLRIWIVLRDSQSNKVFKSLNSMRPDGSMFSGGLFSTARLPGNFTAQVSRENTVCSRLVLTTYLWGSPAETVE